MKRIFYYTADKDYINTSIKAFLKSYYKMSSALITDLKKKDDGIVVNGERKNVTYIIKEKDEIKITITELAENEIVPAKIDFEILYEDEDVMAVNKPPFVPTHPSMGNYDNTLANGVIYYWRQRGEERIFRAVNRLDKNTSGVMLIAKNAYAHARLCDSFHTEDFRRKYIAVVQGKVTNSGTVNAPIARECESIIKRCVREDGQYAVTHYKVLESYEDCSVLEIELETGRTHQIRVHMSYIGHPLVCDFLYGSEECDEMQRQALHSSYLSLVHPVSGERISIECEIADDMKRFIKNQSKMT